MTVSIFGYSEAKPGERLYQEAKETARLLAQSDLPLSMAPGRGDAGGHRRSPCRRRSGNWGLFNPVGMTNFEGRDLRIGLTN